jgi:ABC-2 type transport system permease protein
MNTVRLVFVGGWLSYRALFNWLRPAVYVPSMLGIAIGQVLFFTYVGRYIGVASNQFFVIGNALLAPTIAGIFGVTACVQNERMFGTLPLVIESPASRVAIFVGRSLPFLANGVFISLVGLAFGALALHASISVTRVPLLILPILIVNFGCCGLGMLVGTMAIRWRGVSFVANPVYLLVLIFAGVEVPRRAEPGWLAAAGQYVPLTHGLKAARGYVVHGISPYVVGQAALEVAVGASYFALAYVVFRVLERGARRHASLDFA